MSRPREYHDRLEVKIRLERALHDRLKAVAEARDLSVNRIIEKAISGHVTALEELARIEAPSLGEAEA